MGLIAGGENRTLIKTYGENAHIYVILFCFGSPEVTNLLGLWEEREDDSEKELADVLLLLSPCRETETEGAPGGGSCDIGETALHPLLNLHMPKGWIDKVLMTIIKKGGRLGA